MSMQLQSKINFYGFAVLLVPILMIKLLAAVLGINLPSQVTASPYVDFDLNVAKGGTETVELTSEQLKCAAHIQMLANTPLVGNPLLYEGNTGPEKAPQPSETRRFKLQMIMAFGSMSIALIEGDQYRIGDQIDDSNWVVKEIRRDSRKVMLEHQETGETQLLSVDS